jgi:hypothetical protein
MNTLPVYCLIILSFIFLFYQTDNLSLASAERVILTPENDSLTGTQDNDRISGAGGNDILTGLAGSDEID